MYEIRMQWILTWNEMKLHMHQYDVCRTNDCRYANVCKSQPLLDSYHKIFLSKLWTLQNYLFNSISQQSSECLFDVTDLLTYVFLHEIPQYEKIFVRCSTMHGGLQAGSTLPDPPSELRSEFTIFVQKGWGIFVI